MTLLLLKLGLIYGCILALLFLLNARLMRIERNYNELLQDVLTAIYDLRRLSEKFEALTLQILEKLKNIDNGKKIEEILSVLNTQHELTTVKIHQVMDKIKANFNAIEFLEKNNQMVGSNYFMLADFVKDVQKKLIPQEPKSKRAYTKRKKTDDQVVG